MRKISSCFREKPDLEATMGQYGFPWANIGAPVECMFDLSS